jgi:hypothetical protein
MRFVMLVGCLCVMTLAAGTASGADDPRGDAVVTIKTGAMTVDLSERAAWTIQRIVFKGTEVGTKTGAYGAVVSIPAIGGWVGTGHTEGGIEQIQEIALVVDGEPAELTDGAIYACERAILTKRSMLDKIQLDAILTFENERITEHHVLTATEDVVVSRVYAFMHCVTNATRQWMAHLYDGREKSGEFTDRVGRASSPTTLEWHTGWEWTASYDPISGKGFLLRLLKLPEDSLPPPAGEQPAPADLSPVSSPVASAKGEALAKGEGGQGAEEANEADTGVEVQTGYWDHERYHKLYVQLVTGDTIKEGTVLDCECVVTCFEAVSGAWKERARKLATELVAE